MININWLERESEDIEFLFLVLQDVKYRYMKMALENFGIWDFPAYKE